MNRIRWGLIGCGDIARKRVARAILEDPKSTLQAVCRRDQAKLKQFCDEFGVERSYTSDAALLKDRDIDAVYIATPVNLHLAQTLAAANAKKHVLVEKPMALTTDECDEMIAGCQKRNVKLGVAYYRRFYPAVDRIKELLDNEEIGTTLSVAVTTSANLPAGPEAEGRWRVVLDQGGGGALMDIGSHRLNLLLHVFGEVESLKAFCTTRAGDYEAEDSAIVALKFRSGVLGTLQCHFGGIDPDEFSVLGTDGRIVVRPLNGERLLVQHGDKFRIETHKPARNLHAPLIADFSSAILEDRAPLVSGEEGRDANALMERAYRDARNVADKS